jgi:hypothetical protein
MTAFARKDNTKLGMDPEDAMAEVGVAGINLVNQLDAIYGPGQGSAVLRAKLIPILDTEFGEGDVHRDWAADETRNVLNMMDIRF